MSLQEAEEMVIQESVPMYVGMFLLKLFIVVSASTVHHMRGDVPREVIFYLRLQPCSLRTWGCSIYQEMNSIRYAVFPTYVGISRPEFYPGMRQISVPHVGMSHILQNVVVSDHWCSPHMLGCPRDPYHERMHKPCSPLYVVMFLPPSL